MKAISLWQPWASAIAVGAKTIETRGWETRYRGRLAIHAAKRKSLSELNYFHSCWYWQGALRELGIRFGDFRLDKLLPFGAIVAVCDLVDCRPTGEFTVSELYTPRRPKGETSDIYNWTEANMGDYSLGRYGWILANVRALPEPIPFVGKQGFFSVPDEILRGAA